jgi:GNAT superfamily N-acetyltransferase
MHDYPLNKVNRITLAAAFGEVKRVDLSIDCVVEGQMGRAYVSDPDKATAFMIKVGPLCYFAGEVNNSGALLLKSLEPHSIIMPSPEPWICAAKDIHGERLVEFPRYSFSSQSLNISHLKSLLESSPCRDAVAVVDRSIAEKVYGVENHFFDLSDYDSFEDFVQRGIGYCLVDGKAPVACAYSSLVCSKGAEVSIFVEPHYRRQGVATALACALLIHCIRDKLAPHWDAANYESCRLAEKLGFKATGTYSAFYLRDS